MSVCSFYCFQALNAGVDISPEDQDAAEDLLIQENMRKVEAFEKKGGIDKYVLCRVYYVDFFTRRIFHFYHLL